MIDHSTLAGRASLVSSLIIMMCAAPELTYGADPTATQPTAQIKPTIEVVSLSVVRPLSPALRKALEGVQRPSYGNEPPTGVRMMFTISLSKGVTMAPDD